MITATTTVDCKYTTIYIYIYMYTHISTYSVCGSLKHPNSRLGFGLQGLRGFGFMGFEVQGLGFRGLGLRIWDLGFIVHVGFRALVFGVPIPQRKNFKQTRFYKPTTIRPPAPMSEGHTIAPCFVAYTPLQHMLDLFKPRSSQTSSNSGVRRCSAVTRPFFSECSRFRRCSFWKLWQPTLNPKP